MTCKFQSVLFLTDFQSALCILSSAPSYRLPESLWYVWSLVSSLSNNTSLSFQWVPGHAGLPRNEKADLLAKTGASLPTDAIPSPFPPVSAKVRYCQYRNWRRHISHSHLNFQVPKSLWRLLLSRSIRSELFRLRCHGHSLLLSSIFTGSVGKRILIVVPVDTLYRTSIIFSSTVVLLNPFANLSLAPLSLFSIYGPDLGVWPDCWVSAEFLRAPIPRKGSGSTTTTVINRCQFISECESSSPKIVTKLVDFLTETSASFIRFQITLFLFVAIIN